VLLGRLRHHPTFCGDGRPNLPARLAAYAPAPDANLSIRAGGVATGKVTAHVLRLGADR
jgi:hypothetical protein